MIDTKELKRLNGLMFQKSADISSTKKNVSDLSLKMQKNVKKQLQLQVQLDTTQESYDVLKAFIDDESEQFVNSLRDLITMGLRAIFYDRDYTCNIIISEERSSAEIRLRYTADTISEDGEPEEIDTVLKDGVGYGLSTAIGTLLQIYFINLYQNERILFVDEGFSQISSQYLPKFIEFINQLSIEQGFKILLNTHDERIIEYAQTVYELKEGKMKLIKGENL